MDNFNQIADLDFLPIGSIMPFLKTEIPNGWVPLDGRVMPKDECYLLWDAIYYGENSILDIWRKSLGGEINSESITLPDVSSTEKVWELTYNIKIDKENLPDMALAIKIKRIRTDEEDA